MSTDTREEAQELRAAALAVNDPEFAAARPDQAVSAAIEAAGPHLPQVVNAVLDGYSDRPALAQRAYELVTDSQTGRTSAKLLPWFSQVTYGELADRVGELSRALTDGLITAGDRVCVLGFTSVDYTTIDIALGVIRRRLCAAADQRGDHAIATDRHRDRAHGFRRERRLPVRRGRRHPGLLLKPATPPAGWWSSTTAARLDDNRDALQSAQQRLADLSLTVETLDDIRERGAALPCDRRRRARR